MKRLPIILLAALLAAALALLGQRDTALATASIPAGFDLFESNPGAGNTFIDTTNSPVSGSSFDIGCSDFAGNIDLEGVPIPSFDPGSGPVSPLEPTDTIVERLPPDAGPFPDTIEIEIVALELKSISPITVTGCIVGQSPDWDVRVTLSTSTTQPTGTMTIRHESTDGGTFDSTLPVIPRLEFTRVSDSQFFALDPAPQLDFSVLDVPWCHTPEPLNSPSGHDVVENSLNTDFFPSISCEESTCPGTPCTRNKAFFGLADVDSTDYNGQLSVRSAENIPAVGGIALVDITDSPASPASDSGSSALTYAGLAGAVAAGTVAAAAGGWYARRRFRQ